MARYLPAGLVLGRDADPGRTGILPEVGSKLPPSVLIDTCTLVLVKTFAESINSALSAVVVSPSIHRENLLTFSSGRLFVIASATC